MGLQAGGNQNCDDNNDSTKGSIRLCDTTMKQICRLLMLFQLIHFAAPAAFVANGLGRLPENGVHATDRVETALFSTLEKPVTIAGGLTNILEDYV